MALIGVVIDGNELQGVLVRSGSVVWSRTMPIDGQEPSDALALALRELPSAGRKAAVSIALGARWAQVRRLEELPRVNDATARALVAQGTSRFFLRMGAPLVTTGVEWTEDAAGLSAAFERPFIEQLALACSAHNVRLRAVVPMAALQRSATAGAVVPLPVAVTQLAARDPLAYRPKTRAAPATWKELSFAIVALMLALLALEVAPGIAGVVSASAARGEIALLRSKVTDAGPARRALAELSARAALMAQFAARARSQTLVLGRLAEQLPPEAFVTSLRTDSAGGTAVVIAENPHAALQAVQKIPGIARAEMAGPIMRETVGGAATQRLTIRFLWSAVQTGGQVAAPTRAVR